MITHVKRKFHEYHCQGDITLQSSDGILFGVDAWRLSKASTVFRDLFDTPRPELVKKARLLAESNSDNEGEADKDEEEEKLQQSHSDGRTIRDENVLDIKQEEEEPSIYGTEGTFISHTPPEGSKTVSEEQEEVVGAGSHGPEGNENERGDNNQEKDDGEPILINTRSTTLGIFIDLCLVAQPFIPSVTFTKAAELLRLCDQYGCRIEVENAIRARLYKLGRTAQWELLVLASKRDDVVMGRRALGYMDIVVFAQTVDPAKERPPLTASTAGALKYKDFWTRISMLSPLWQASLFPRIIKTPAFSTKSKFWIESREWPSDWKDFDP